MAIGTGTALLIGAGISAGTQVAGAKMASNASNKAADQQVQATDKGLALQRDIYSQQVAGMQPYATGGLNAYNSLNSLMGLPIVGAAAPAAPGTATGPVDPMVANIPANRRATPENGTGVFAIPRRGTLGEATQSSYRSPASGVVAGQQQAQPTGGSFAVRRDGGMVQMQSPTGELATVPADQVDHFTSLGARRV